MKKSLLAVGIFGVLGLSGCLDGKSIDIPEETEEVLEAPYVRVVFNPATGDLNIPNDLLMVPSNNFFDFTLNTEGDEDFDPANPEHVLSALDGWSAHMPFSIRVSLTDDLDIDASTIDGSSIRIFKATQALEGDSENCLAIAAAIGAPGLPCELGDELQYGVDFFASYTPASGAIDVIPLKPMSSSQGHMLVVTEELKSTDGRAVKGSIIWELARQDITTNTLGSDELVQLQGIVNSLVNVLQPSDLTTEDVSYAAYFTTQSTGDALTTLKQLNIAPYAQAFQQTLEAGADLATASATAALFLPSISTELPAGDGNVFEALAPSILTTQELAELEAVGLNTCDGLISALSDTSSPLNTIAASTFAIAGPFCAAKIVEGEVNLPYYLSTTEPATDWWKAACTSGATLQSLGADIVAQLIQGGQVGDNNDLCQLATDGALYDLDLSSLGFTGLNKDPRNITKFNPIPVAQGREQDNETTLYNEAGTESVKVLFTVPDETVIATLSAATGGLVPVITKPENGWPVVVFQHGITESKSNVFALASALSLAGYASAAIDHPLHGDRTIELDDGSTVNATINGATDFLNLLSLLTARDNSRQSVADIMAFRLSLNAINDTTGFVELDTSNVNFIGQSLGAIYGSSAVSLSNNSLGGDLAAFDSMYAFNTAVLNVPLVGVASSLFDSAFFGANIKGTLLSASSPEFQSFLTTYATQNNLSVELAIGPAYAAFELLLTDEQLNETNSIFAAFSFAAQTAIDASDPISYVASLASTTPTLVQLVVGGGTNDDGSTALTDQVNPVETSLPLAGGQALANIMGLSQVTQTSQGSGLVRFISGDHQSFLNPVFSLNTTTEMQNQAVAFLASGGESIVVTDTSVIEN